MRNGTTADDSSKRPPDAKPSGRLGPTARRGGLARLALSLPLLFGACDFEWGGAELRLDRPETRGEAASDSPAEEGPAPPELPEGPLLFLVSPAEDGRALLAPAARLVGGRPAALGWPEAPPEAYRARFDSAFARPGSELPLFHAGKRLGTAFVERSVVPDAACPSVVRARLLLTPGTPAPETALVISGAAVRDPPEPHEPPALGRNLRVFAPILAERLLSDAGVPQATLFRRGALVPLELPGDTTPGMAATYLLNDSLAPVPAPEGTSASLFFVARHVPARGYEPTGALLRAYGEEGGSAGAESARKEVYSYLDRLPPSGDGVFFLRRTEAGRERLAALDAAPSEEDPAAREPAWVESERCPALELLSSAREAGNAEAAGPSPGS